MHEDKTFCFIDIFIIKESKRKDLKYWDWFCFVVSIEYAN